MCQHLNLLTLATSSHVKKISIPIEVTANEAYTTLHLSNATRPVRFLIDSGACLCFVSSNIIKPHTPVDTTKTVIVTSATGHSVNTIALLHDTIFFNDMTFVHEFNLFNENLPIAADGILGMDFFLKFKAILNFSMSTFDLVIPISQQVSHSIEDDDSRLSFQDIDEYVFSELFIFKDQEYFERQLNKGKQNDFKFPTKSFENKVNALPLVRRANLIPFMEHMYTGANKKTILVPEGTVSNVKFKINHPNGDYILDKINIMPNVFIRNAIFRITDNTTILPIENYNDFPVIISITQLQNINFLQSNFFQILTLKHQNITSRFDYIVSKLKLTHCSDENAAIIKSLCKEFSDCFYVEGDTINHTDIITHTIELKPDAKPVFTKQYRLPESQKIEIQKQLHKMEQEGIIEKCLASGWNSPIILVPKSDDDGQKTKFRLVVDFRKLNEATIPIQFPIPQIDSIIDRLANSTLFSKLDLRSAFYQIKLDNASRKYTTFENNSFSYRFISMPQGLHTSPAAMQNAVNLLFSDLLNKGVNIYLDDILVYSDTLTKHIHLLREIFNRLRKHKFKLRAEKSDFCSTQVEYLGFVINKDGCLPNPMKVNCINNYPKPTNVAELQRYLGLCNYYRKHIKFYGQVAQPLYNLLKKNTPFNWCNSCDKAFNDLKHALVNPPILIFPDFTKIFIVTTDASALAIGAVLSQGTLPNDKPIQYVSRVLNPAQQNYSTIEKELLAIVWAIDQFKHILYGFEFILYTDHRPLVYLFNLKNPSSKLFRWRLLLSEYQFKIVYKQGSQNVVADALSRINYDPIDLNVILNTSETTNFLAVTRSKAISAENTLLQNSSETTAEHKQDHNFYEIVENNDILTNTTNTDHIYYFFSTKNCEMKRKWEYRTKTNIILPEDLIPYAPYSLNDKQTIFWTPKENHTDQRIAKLKLVLNSILHFSTKHNYNDIALNIDIKEVNQYFEFKYLFKETFKNTAIKTKFYLNKVIDVFELDQILDILNTYHNSSLAGHSSFEKTKNSITRYYRWPTMYADIKKFVKNCEICKKSKIARHTKSPMQITSTSEYPFQKVYIDFVNVEREHSNTFPNIFTCIDDLTRYAIAVKTHDCTALTAAKVFVENVLLKYNIPEVVVSDLGSAFISNLFKEITKLFKIKKISTTAYRPNANIVERFHRTLAQHITACVHTNPLSWHEHLDSALFAYNNNIHSSTGYSPQELLFGFRIQLPDKITKSIDPLYNYDNYAEDLRFNLAKYWALAKINIDKRKQANKDQRDSNSNPISLSPGDQVLMIKPFKTHKYDSPYDGPFTVEEIVSPVTIVIKKGNKLIKVHADKLKLA